MEVLEHLGFKSVFKGVLNKFIRQNSSSPKLDTKDTVSDGLKAVREEIDALQKLLERRER